MIGCPPSHDGGGSAAVERYTLPEYDCLFPVTSLTVMAEVLAGAHGPAPVALVAYHCSGVLRDRVSLRMVAISVDRKPCALRGLHACLDVADVVEMVDWQEAYFSPICYLTARSDTTCMHHKLRDGRFWWGVARVARCLCAPSLKTIVEQPLNFVEEALGIEASQTVDPREYDDFVKKSCRFWVLGGALIAPPEGLQPTAPSAPLSVVTRWHRHIADDALRDEARVSWAFLPGVASAVAEALGRDGGPHPGYRFDELIEATAERLYDWGVPIPWDYANADARPTSLPDRDYSEERAAGDGRSTAGIKPRRVRDRERAASVVASPGSTAHAASECRSVHLQYRRPPQRPAQPAGCAASSSSISRIVARGSGAAVVGSATGPLAAGDVVAPGIESLVERPPVGDEAARRVSLSPLPSADARAEWTIEQMGYGAPYPTGDPRWCEVTASGTESAHFPADRRNALRVAELRRECAVGHPLAASAGERRAVPVDSPLAALPGGPSSSVSPAPAFSPLRPARSPAPPRGIAQAPEGVGVPGVVTLLRDLVAESVVLVPVNLHCRPPLVLLPDLPDSCMASPAGMPGKAPGARRADASRRARSMLASLLPSHGPSPVAQCHMVGAACVGGSPSVYVVAAPISRLRNASTAPSAPTGHRWRPLSSGLTVGVFTLAKVALLGVACLADPAVRMVAGVRTGAIPDSPTTRGVSSSAPLAELGMRAALIDRELQRAADLFDASAGADPEQATMWRSWLEVFQREPAPPVEALSASRSLSSPLLALLPFPVTVINASDPVRPPPPQPPLPPSVVIPDDPMRTYLPWAQYGMARQAAALTRHHRGVGKRPRTKAWGEDARKLPFRGTILDYRGGVGTGKLLDVSSPAVATHLNLEAWRRHFAGSRNRRLFSFALHGVQYRDTLPLQTMMAANLGSLQETVGGVDAVIDALDGMRRKHGWLAQSRDWRPLIIPCRHIPTGAADRKVDPLVPAAPEPRPIGDNGHPHGPPTQEVLTEGAREPVESLNVSAGPMRHAEGALFPKWWTERKATAQHAAIILAILGHMAHLLDTIVFLLAFDFSKFFHQLVLCGSEIWKTGRILPERLAAGGVSRDMVALVELVLAMGVSPASNICQELADDLMARLTTLVGEASADLIANWSRAFPAFASVMVRRAALDHDDAGTQCRITGNLMYTDDSLKAAVGPQGAVIVASCFWRLVGPVHMSCDVVEVASGVCRLLGIRHVAATVPRPGGLNFIAARTTKWGGGASAVWVGVGFSGAWGILWIPPQKRLRTMRSVDWALSGTMPVAEYRSLYGFLVSIKFMLDGGPYILAGLQRPMLDGHELSQGLTTPVRVDHAMRSRLLAVARAVADCGAVSVLAAVSVDNLPPHPSPYEWVIGGDAALEDASDPHQGLGACCWGLKFQVRLDFDSRLRLLAISALEAMTAGCVLCVYGPMLAHASRVVIASDALATALFLGGGRKARSCVLATIHECIRATPAWRDLNYPVCRLWNRHTWGEVNTLHDGASRGYDDVVSELNSAVGLETTDIGFERAVPFLRACLDSIDALHARWRSAGYLCAPLEPTAVPALGSSVGAYDSRGEPITAFGQAGGGPPGAGAAGWAFLWATIQWLSVQLLLAVLSVGAHLRAVWSSAARFAWARVVSLPSLRLQRGMLGDRSLMRRRPAAASRRRLPLLGMALLLMTFVLPSSCVERHLGEFGHDDGRPAVAWFHLLDGDRMVDGMLEEATMAYPVPEGTAHASRYLVYPPDRVGGQPPLTRLELLRELEFCDGYLPDASYVTLLSIEGRDNQRHDVDWAVSSVAELREHITSGRFRQHWYVYNRGGFYGPARSSPESEGSPSDYGRGPDYYSLMAECDSCGEAFDPSVRGTLDWQGCGLENCGCGSECSLGPVPPGLAYDAAAEAIRFVRYSPAQRAASLAVPSDVAKRHRRGHTRPSSRGRHVDANASLLARARGLVPVSSSLTGPSGCAKALASASSTSAPGGRDAASGSVGAPPPIFSRGLRATLAEAVAATTVVADERSAAVSNYMEARVETSISALKADTSRLALRPPSWDLLRGLMASSNAALERRVPLNTKRLDRCYWRKWCEYCALFATPPIRDDVAASTGADVVAHRREQDLVEACFMLWVSTNPQYKVTSMLARLRGVARIHKVSLKLPFVQLSFLVQICKGLVQERIDEQGPESLNRLQKEPLQNWMIIRWLTLSRGAVGGVPVGRNLGWQGIRCLIAYFASTGARKADVALDVGVTFGLRHLSLWHATWEIRGEVVKSPTAEQLGSLCENCYVHLTSVPCKNDPDGTKFAGTPTTCRYHPTAPINFVRELALYEIMRGVPGEQRRTTPLLLDPLGRVWRKPVLTAFFKALLLSIMSPEAARSYSVHSFRIYLACALHAQGATAERIMMMLRWSSIASLLVYCRPNASTVSSWVHTAASADIDAVRASTLQSGHALRPGGTSHAPPRPVAAPAASSVPPPVASGVGGRPNRSAPPVMARAVAHSSSAASAVLLDSRSAASAAHLPRSAAVLAGGDGLSPVQSDWLEAEMPPPLPASARVAMVAGLDMVHRAQYQDIGAVDVSAVVSVDDDHLIASLRGSMPALERMAAAADAESAASYSAGSVFSPVVPEDGGSEGSDAGAEDEW